MATPEQLAKAASLFGDDLLQKMIKDVRTLRAANEAGGAISKAVAVGDPAEEVVTTVKADEPIDEEASVMMAEEGEDEAIEEVAEETFPTVTKGVPPEVIAAITQAVTEAVAMAIGPAVAALDIDQKMGSVQDMLKELKGAWGSASKEATAATAVAQKAEASTATVLAAAAGAHTATTGKIEALEAKLAGLLEAHATITKEIQELSGEQPSGPPAHVASSSGDTAVNLASFAAEAFKTAQKHGTVQEDINAFLTFAAGVKQQPQPNKSGLS